MNETRYQVLSAMSENKAIQCINTYLIRTIIYEGDFNSFLMDWLLILNRLRLLIIPKCYDIKAYNEDNNSEVKYNVISREIISTPRRIKSPKRIRIPRRIRTSARFPFYHQINNQDLNKY
jgi:hypothetical protein